jgi:4-alpha-glucanotransferase
MGDAVEYSHGKKVEFFGDIPFYINHDSADCWAHPEYFKLDRDKKPTSISGVPPDYFSETGQLWGTPVFDWKNLKKNRYDWWISRLKQNLRLFDLVRLDHFRAFSAYWEVPAGEETAKNGKWTPVSGKAFFKEVQKAFPNMPFIAEDLGELDQPVFDLLDAFDFPGMKVLQFAFGEEIGKNPYISHNHKPNSVVFTGTHDNNTTVGWFNVLPKEDIKRFREYVGIRPTRNNIHMVMHRLALMSVSAIAIVPIQDVLGLDEKAIMNKPGTSEGNWNWRLKPDQLPLEKAEELLQMNILYGRWEVEKKKKSKETKSKKQKIGGKSVD